MLEPVLTRSADAVDEAIERVLRAEREAGQHIARCAEEAEQRVRNARSRARAIAERAGERTAAVRRIAATRLAERLAALERERQALLQPADDDAADLRVVQSAVERLAAALTGEEHGGAP